ncbi:MAG: tetratricopeptide repeat protein [Alphaproteobacteria bacterium]
MSGLRVVAIGFLAGALASCAAMRGATDSGRSASGSYLSGNFAAAEGDLNSAAAFYAETLKGDPGNADLLARTFLLSATSGDTERAISLAKRITKQQPDNRAARLVLTTSAFAKKNYVQAADEMRLSSQGPFTSLTKSLLEAWALAGQRDYDGALKALGALQSQSGAQGLFAFHYALMLDYAGRTEAEAAYRTAMTVLGNSPRIAEAYGRYLEVNGKADVAQEVYRNLAKERPGHPLPRVSLARIAAGEKPEPMIETPAQGAAESLFGIAASLTEDRSSDVAIFYLNLALYLRPDLDLGRVLLADHYEQRQKYDIANAIYGKIQPSSPYYDMVSVQSAINEARLGREEKAIADLKRMGRQRPKDVDVWTALGDLYRGQEKYADAVAVYSSALAAIAPDDDRRWGLYYARGVTYERSKRWDLAERDLKESLRLKPDQPQVLNYLGYSWVDQGRNLNEAVGMLEKARSLRPLDGYIVDSVGWAYYRLGRYKDAAAALEEAVLLSPSDPTINDHLGDAYWRIGRKNEARFQWNHAIGLDPNAQQKAAIEKKIQHGLEAATAGGAP